MDGHFGVTPPISPGSVTEADVNAGYAISCGPEQSPLGGPTHGLTSSGRTPHPPGRLTPKPTSYGAQYRPVGVMETQAEVDIDAVMRELDNELEAVRSQIRFRAVGGRKLPFPIPKASGLYNSLYYRTSRDGNVQYDNPYYGPPSGGNFVASQTYGSPQYDTPTSGTYGMPPSPE